MFKNFLFQGAEFTSEVRRRGNQSSCTLRATGDTEIQLQPLNLRFLDNSTFQILSPDGFATGRYAIHGKTYFLHIGGRSFRFEEVSPGDEPGATQAAVHRSAMPGKVLAVHVKPGDQVRAGDSLVTVEAMKMENVLRAGFDGEVLSVSCSPGAVIAPEDPLVELKPGAAAG